MDPQQQGAEQGEQQYAAGGQMPPGGNVVLGSIAHGQPAPGVYPSYSQQLQEQMAEFWRGQMQEVEQVNEFKSHSLPLARIKKIMKADEDVRMISGEAPVLFAKACEMFILELTLRAWNHTEENKRRTLQKNDIAAAVTRTDIFDFLVDIVPRDDIKEEGLGLARAMPIGPTPDMFHYMMPGQGGVMPRPGAPLDPAMYAQQRPLYMPQQQWNQQEQQNQQPAQESTPSGE